MNKGTWHTGQQPLVDRLIRVSAFMTWTSFHINHLWCEKWKGVFLMNVLYLSPLTGDLLQERKQESSRVVAEAPKINQRSLPSCQKNTLSKHVPTRATSWTPVVSSCTGSSAAGYWSAGSSLLWPVVTVELVPGGSTGSSLIFWWGLCLPFLS